MIVCRTCAKEQPEELYKKGKTKYGLDCAICIKAKHKQWREANPDRLKHIRDSRKLVAAEENKRWRAVNKAYIYEAKKRYREENKEAIAQKKKLYCQMHPDKHKARNKARRAQKKLATSLWANKFFIHEIYNLAKLRTRMLGKAYTVDHIIPLQGKNVCGLHVEYNLRIVLAKENYQKHNHYEVTL